MLPQAGNASSFLITICGVGHVQLKKTCKTGGLELCGQESWTYCIYAIVRAYSKISNAILLGLTSVLNHLDTLAVSGRLDVLMEQS